MAVVGVEVVAEPGQVQGDLAGDLGGAHAADGGIEIGRRLPTVDQHDQLLIGGA